MRTSALRHRLIAVFFVNFVVFGAGAIVIGATVPKIIRDFGWSYLVMGGVLAAGSAGYFGSTFLCGLAVHRWGPKGVLLSTTLLQAVGLLAFGTEPSVAVNLFAIVLIGLGQGGTEVGTNYCVVRMEPGGRSRLMNLIHAAFPMGAILASLTMGMMLDAGVPWQVMFRVLAGLCVLVAVAFAVLAFEPSPERPGREPSRRTLGRLLRQPLLLLLALVVFLYVGVEIGVSNWVSEYFVQVLRGPLSVGAGMVSVLWFGLLLGRLGISAAYRSHRQAPLLVGLTAIATLCLGSALATPAVWGAALLFFGVGVGLSAIYPAVIVLVGQHYPEDQGLAIGVVSTAGGIGSFSFPFIMSGVAERLGMVAGFAFYACVSGLMCAAAVAAGWRAR